VEGCGINALYDQSLLFVVLISGRSCGVELHRSVFSRLLKIMNFIFNYLSVLRGQLSYWNYCTYIKSRTRHEEIDAYDYCILGLSFSLCFFFSCLSFLEDLPFAVSFSAFLSFLE